jgi:hypothetical protein
VNLAQISFCLNLQVLNNCSLESPGIILSSGLILSREIRKLILRYLCLPRPSFLAIKSVAESPNSKTGQYNFVHKTLQPWYIEPTIWNKWGPRATLYRIFGGKPAGTGGDRFYPQGYDLNTIGPKPFEDRGKEEMAATVRYLKARGAASCPFSS